MEGTMSVISSGDEGSIIDDGVNGDEGDVSDSEDEGNSVLAAIDYLEDVLRDMKRGIVAADGNKALELSLVYSEHKHLEGAMKGLKRTADDEAATLINDLFAIPLVPENYTRYSEEGSLGVFWDIFHEKAKALEAKGVSAELRKRCLFIKANENGSTLLHLVCKLNPPVEVVETLLNITPARATRRRDREWEESEIFRFNPSDCEFNHLGVNDDKEYPLHLVMKHGAVRR
jgi:hypothetical protein